MTARQERQVFRWINGKNPRQYGFDFGLWTRQIVRELITQRFGVRLSLASIGAVLARQGLTLLKPLQRAYQRDPVAIARWQRKRIRRLRAPPRGTRPRSISGTSPAFEPMRCMARPGGQGTDPGGVGPRSEAGHQRRLGDQFQGSLLVRHLCGRTEWCAVHYAIAPAAGRPSETPASDPGWVAGT